MPHTTSSMISLAPTRSQSWRTAVKYSAGGTAMSASVRTGLEDHGGGAFGDPGGEVGGVAVADLGEVGISGSA